jgi:hypothetical protein
MKWLLSPLLLSAFALAACGGGGPSPSPSPSPLAACNGALPDGSIAFLGRIVSLEAPTPYQSELSVSVERISGRPGTAVYGHEQDWVNSVLNVTWPGMRQDISDLKTGDCVLGSGVVQQYVTHPNVTLSAFVAERLTPVAGPSAEPASAQPSADVQGSDWLIAQVLSVRTLTTGYRDVTVQLENIVDSTFGDQAQPSDVKHIILPDSLNLPAVAAGDVVEVVGAQQRYPCGDSCDAAGFVASYVRKLEY